MVEDTSSSDTKGLMVEPDPGPFVLEPVEPGRTPKTSERVARHLASEIVAANLTDGSKLPTERDMIDAYGVGRATLREALRLLETRGILSIRRGPGGGPVVRRPRPEDLSEALTLILQFEKASLRQVLHTRMALEPSVARLAAVNITDEQIDALQATVDLTLGNVDSQRVFLEQNRRFHGLIAEASGNAVMSLFVDTLKYIADGAIVGVEYSVKRRRGAAAAHQRIVDALRAHDAERVAESMKEHLEEAERFWERRYADLVSRRITWTTSSAFGVLNGAVE